MRQKVQLDIDVLDRLKKYTRDKYGNRRALSAVIQLAIVKFLDEEESRSGSKKKQTTSRVKAI